MVLQLKSERSQLVTTKEGATIGEIFRNLSATSGEKLATFGDLLRFKKLLKTKIFLKNK